MKFNKGLGLIGIGYWGKNLARNFNALGSLHTVCDIHSHYIEKYQSIYSDVTFTNSIDELLDSPHISQVAIAVPTEFHFKIAKLALQRGKDVFVEKAMCSNLQQAFELKELAKENNKILMVGHLLNYHPCIQKIKKMLDENLLGELQYFDFNRLNFGSNGSEKSALWAFAPHDLSIMLNLAEGYLIESLQSQHKSYYSKCFGDQSWIHINFNRGLTAHIRAGWMNPFPERKIVVCGTAGAVVFDDMQNWDYKLKYWQHAVSEGENKLNFNQSKATFIKVESKEPLYEECLHFLECCQSREEPFTNGEEGYQVMKLLDAAEKGTLNLKNLLTFN